MDAEIGVRNLADSFRYNALPQVAKAIGLVDRDVDDLPDYERLAVLVSPTYHPCISVFAYKTTTVPGTARAQLRHILVLRSGRRQNVGLAGRG